MRKLAAAPMLTATGSTKLARVESVTRPTPMQAHLVTRSGPGEHEIRDIRARDQQHGATTNCIVQGPPGADAGQGEGCRDPRVARQRIFRYSLGRPGNRGGREASRWLTPRVPRLWRRSTPPSRAMIVISSP